MISNQDWDDMVSNKGTLEVELGRIKSGLDVIRMYIETKRGDLTDPQCYIGLDFLFDGITCYCDHLIDTQISRTNSEHSIHGGTMS